MRRCLSWPEGKWRRGPSLDLDQFLGWAKTSHMLPCEDVSVGPKEGTTQSFTWSWLVSWAGQDKSYVVMWRCLDWPEGRDDAILHLILISSLGGPRQVVCCHVKMSRLAQRKWRCNPSHALLRKWSSCEDNSASPKEFLGRAKTVRTALKYGWIDKSPILTKFQDSLTEWLNEFFGKKL
jgi:hypothetical protein